MTGEVCDGFPATACFENVSRFLHPAGFRCRTASLLPALIGTTLPFWLRPPGFSFRWLGAIEFLFAPALFHAGFSLLQARFEGRSTSAWPSSRLLGGTASVCIFAACLLGLHVNRCLNLHYGFHSSILALRDACYGGIHTIFLGSAVADRSRFTRYSTENCEGLVERLHKCSEDGYGRRYALMAHLTTCIVIVASSLATLLH